MGGKGGNKKGEKEKGGERMHPLLADFLGANSANLPTMMIYKQLYCLVLPSGIHFDIFTSIFAVLSFTVLFYVVIL